MPGVVEVKSNFLYVDGRRPERVNGKLGKTEIDRTSDIGLWQAKPKTLHREENGTFFGYFSKSTQDFQQQISSTS